MQLKLSKIRTDGGTQSRAAINEEVVQEYLEAISDGRTATFPDIVVFHDGQDYWLADGFHRVEAFKRAGREKVSAQVEQGTVREAILYSCGANTNHGLRRTNDDKRRAVTVLLNDPEWAKWSDREIARRCGVHHDLVGTLRTELSGGIRQIEERQVTRNGTTFSMKLPEHKPMFTPPPFKAFCPTCNKIREDWTHLESNYSFAHRMNVHTWECPDCHKLGYQDDPGQPVYFVYLAWYAVDDKQRWIYLDPMPANERAQAAAWYPGCEFLEGHILQEEKGHFAAFELLPPQRQLLPLPPAEPIVQTTKYQPGMKARCGKCEVHYPGYNPIHDNWQRDTSKDNPIWICPHHHRVSDQLMDIVEANEAGVPSPAQEPEPAAAAQEESPALPPEAALPDIDRLNDEIDNRIEWLSDTIADFYESYGEHLIEYCKRYASGHNQALVSAILNICEADTQPEEQLT